MYRLRHLLNKTEADVDTTCEEDFTPLHLACLGGFEECVQELVSAGADLDAESTYGTPLCLAALKEHDGIDRLLLSQRARPDAPGGRLGSALHAATFTGNALIVDCLIDGNASVDLCRKTCALMWRGGCWREFFLLTSRPDSKLCQLKYIERGDRGADVMLLIYRHNSKLAGSCCSYSLHSSKLPGEVTRTQCNCYLLGREGDDCTALHIAAGRGHVEITNLLVRSGANVNAENHSEYTPIVEATLANHPACIVKLANGGADLSVRTIPNRCSLLMHAAQWGNLESVRALIAQGATLSPRDGSFATEMDVAAKAGNIECLKILWHAGGRAMPWSPVHSPLLFAAQNGHLHIVKYLCGPARAREQRDSGKTPDYADTENEQEPYGDVGSNDDTTQMSLWNKEDYDYAAEQAVHGRHPEVAEYLRKTSRAANPA